MATRIPYLLHQLKQQVKWQQTPTPFTDADYGQLIIRALRILFVNTTRGEQFSERMFTFDAEGVPTEFAYDLAADEREYVLLTAQILFFKRVQTQVNNMVSYTTDALSITNADKPYANIKDTISNLQRWRRQVYYDMRRFIFQG